MTVLAELVGHPFDLDTLARQFPTGHPRIIVDGEGTFLATDALDDVFTEAAQMLEIANKPVTRLNSWATLFDAGYRPVRGVLASMAASRTTRANSIRRPSSAL